MEEWIKKSDVVKAFDDVLDCDFSHVSEETPRERIEAIPSADRPQGKWIDEAISIIDDMQREGIVDYQQAWEFRMRARMKGADDVLR